MHSIPKALAALLSIGAILALGACASVTATPYPASWAPFVPGSTADGCPGLEGTYSNSSTGAFPPETGDPPPITSVFARLGRGTGRMNPSATGRVWTVPPDAISVSIDQTPETLRVTFSGENGAQSSLDFRRHHFNMSEERFDDIFACYASDTDSRLRFVAEPDPGGLVFLLRATDGSLIVESRGRIGGRGFLSAPAPPASSWWRYPLLRDSQ
jgi:hypothetical protein